MIWGKKANKSLYLLIICIGGLHTKHQASVTYWKVFQKEYATYENICWEPRNNQWCGELFLLILSCFPLTILPASPSADTYLPVSPSYAEAGCARAAWGTCGRPAAVLLFGAFSAQKPRPPKVWGWDKQAWVKARSSSSFSAVCGQRDKPSFWSWGREL